MNVTVKTYAVSIWLATVTVLSSAQVKPSIECLRDNCDGTYTVFFAYESTAEKAIRFPAGTENAFHGNAVGDAQPPAAFKPGKHTVPQPVVFWGRRFVWELGGDSAVAAAFAADHSCMSNPPPAVRAYAEKIMRRGPLIGREYSGSDLPLKLGAPFRYFISTPDKYGGFEAGAGVFAAVHGWYHGWVYPVILGDRAVAYFKIEPKYSDGKYDMNRWSYGGSGNRPWTAWALDMVRKAWPLEQGYHPFLVLVQDGRWLDTFYFSVPELKEPNLTNLDKGDVQESKAEFAALSSLSEDSLPKRFRSLSQLDRTIELLKEQNPSR